MQSLKDVREQLGVSQQDLEVLARTSITTLSLVENGKVYPNKKLRGRIETVVGEVDWLATRFPGFCADCRWADAGAEPLLREIRKWVDRRDTIERPEKIEFIREYLETL